MTPATNELPAIGFLADVSSEYRSFLACFGRFIRPVPGDVLIKEGERQEALFMILSGNLHIVSKTGDRQALLASLKEGDSIGEINLFDPDTASATAIFRSSGLVWSLSREELDAFLEADPAAGVPVLRGLLCQVSKRIRSMNEKLTSVEETNSLHNYWSATS
jgi:CRP/FNR family cyclic AMP-dependent transcriptional regulator